MMQNLPFLESKNVMTQNVPSQKSSSLTQKTNESGTSFKQVLSQQVAHEPSKGEAVKESSAKVKPQKSAVKTSESDSAESVSDDQSGEDYALTATEIKPGDAEKKDKLSKGSGDDEITTKTPEETNAALIASLQLPATNTNLAIDATTLGASKTQAATGLTGAVELKAGKVTDAKLAVEKPDVLLEESKKSASIVDEPAAVVNKYAAGVTTEAGNQTDNKFLNALNDTSVARTLKEAILKPTLESPSLQAMASAPGVASQIATQLAAAQIEASSTNIINAYPGKAGWDQAISQKVVWMVGAAEQSATLTLNPPDLGPLQVVINVNNDKADTTFISDNPEVRKALESGISTLRGLMDQAGVQLGQANVSTGKQQQEFQQAARERSSQQSFVNSSSQPTEPAVSTRTIARVNNGLVDTFA